MGKKIRDAEIKKLPYMIIVGEKEKESSTISVRKHGGEDLGNFKIDFTFLNIVNNKNMIKRLKLRKSLNRYDKFNNKFYSKVQKGF